MAMALLEEDPRNSYEISADQQISINQAAASLRGQCPSQKRSKEELLREHYQNISLLEESSKSGRVKQLILPTAYGPSTLPLDNLQKISLNDLQLEAHHRGRFLTAKTITPPYVSTEVITIIEEDSGDVAILSLCYQDGSSLDSIPPQNSTIAVKEPFCKSHSADGDFIVRVDHTSDIAILRGDDPTLSMIMQYVAEKKEISRAEWKVAGDRAYLDRKYSSAIECYTQAIETTVKEDQAFIRDVYRKRAFANLTARNFDFAKEDALASCSGDTIDAKAYYCAARAAYELGRYQDSKAYFEKSLQYSPNDPKSTKDHSRATARISEEEDGDYDFRTMITYVNDRKVHLDHADFLKNTAVGPSLHHGRGLFATQLIEAGGLVLCEKAFCLPDKYGGSQESDLVLYNFNTAARTERAAQPALFLQLVQKVSNNPYLTKRFFDLDSGNYLRSGKEGDLVDGVPIIDSFLVESIRLKNCFSSPRLTRDLLKKHLTDEDSDLSTGLWTHSAYINHSCIPNCNRSFIGDMMILRATHDIPAGTEITHQYMAPDPPYKARQDSFRANWDFECDCLLCSTEKLSPDFKHKQRWDTVNKIKADVLKWSSASKIPDATIRYVERLTKKLDELHEAEVYKDIPRLFLVHPTIWLAEAYRSLRNPAKTIKYALEILRNFGFMNPVRDGKLQLDYSRAITNRESLNALLYAVEAYQVIGKVELSKQCEREARKMFLILSGSGEGYEECIF